MLKHRLREQRLKNRLRTAQVAQYVNKQRSTISGYEGGRREPDIQTLKRLALLFGVSVDYLIGLTDNPDPLQDKRDIRSFLQQTSLHYGGVPIGYDQAQPLRDLALLIAQNAEYEKMMNHAPAPADGVHSDAISMETVH